MTHTVFDSFILPNGNVVKNRIVKAAMEENMAIDGQLPGEALFNLYQAWAQGGAGVIITGNVMVDHLAMTGPGGVALEKNTPLEPFKVWAQAAKQYPSMDANKPSW
jgi:2,4-dienoyl-CoA reductase-like NADH-dependent reductase (Old Yellow Enzyme family)